MWEPNETCYFHVAYYIHNSTYSLIFFSKSLLNCSFNVTITLAKQKLFLSVAEERGEGVFLQTLKILNLRIQQFKISEKEDKNNTEKTVHQPISPIHHTHHHKICNT